MSQVSADQLRERYRAYIETLNAKEWENLPEYLATTVTHNAKPLDNDGYRALIPPDTHFVIADLVVDPDSRKVASRLEITVAGVKHTEHCFYRFSESQVIEKVWSLVVEGEATGAHGE
jgi:predicted ester cyclase